MIPALPGPVAGLEGVLALLVELVAYVVAGAALLFVWIRVVKLEEAIAQRIPTRLFLVAVAVFLLLVFGVIPLP